MSGRDEVVERLDLILGTLQLAFEAPISEARDRYRSDPVVAAILDETDDWVSSGELQQRVAKSTSKSTRTVRERLRELADKRVLSMRGPGNRTEYRNSGIL